MKTATAISAGRAYEVIFERGGHDLESIVWNGSRQEVHALARRIACVSGARFRVVDLDAGAAELLKLRLLLQLNALRQTLDDLGELS